MVLLVSDGGQPIKESDDDIHLPTEALLLQELMLYQDQSEAIPLEDLGQVKGQQQAKLGQVKEARKGQPEKRSVGSSGSSSGAAEVKQTLDKTVFKDNVRPPPNTPTVDKPETVTKRSKIPTSKSAKGTKTGHSKHGPKGSKKLHESLDLSSSDSNEEMQSKCSHTRTLRKTRSRGKGKGDKDLCIDALGIDNQGYASESEKDVKVRRPKAHSRSRSSGRLARKECWS